MKKIFILLCCLPLLAFCEKDSGDGEVSRILEQYVRLSTQRSATESFLFFTDPHLLSYNDYFGEDVKTYLTSCFTSAKMIYDQLPLSFCICGGDWLNAGDTQAVAKEKLLFADGLMKSMFSRYYKMFGNHDTNYQGVVSAENSSRGDLPRSFIDKRISRRYGNLGCC